MKIYYSAKFSKSLKKVNFDLLEQIESNLKIITQNPDIGQLKKGDLKNLRVHKFRFQNEQYLICYTLLKNDAIQIIYFGVHENFYRNVKNYLNS